jgi:hypothetical protein
VTVFVETFAALAMRKTPEPNAGGLVASGVWTDHTAPSRGRGSRNDARTALKTLPDCSEFYNAPNEIKGSTQTTNPGVRSSNLFGRANDFNKVKTHSVW